MREFKTNDRVSIDPRLVGADFDEAIIGTVLAPPQIYYPGVGMYIVGLDKPIQAPSGEHKAIHVPDYFIEALQDDHK